MAGYRKKNADGPNSEDKALDLFAEMMIEKIEGIQKDWKKPWFTEGALQWPRNLHGREYNGMNAFMLLLHCEKEGYKIPRFCTFDCVQKLNKSGKDGEELPRVSVLRGEKSFPVMLTISIRRPRRKSSMTITRNSPMTKRNSTMFIRRCRFSGSSMLRRPICRKRDRSCGKNWSRKIRVRQSRRASITVLPQSIR